MEIIHGTSYENYLKIKSSGYLKISGTIDKPDQFPGVYTTLRTNINKKLERLYPASVRMYLNPILLKQQNWHFNLYDQNGVINENTYFPWNINIILPYLKKTIDFSVKIKGDYTGNELIFHDNIPFNYVVKIEIYENFIDEPGVYKESKLKETIHLDENLNRTPNMTLLPFYAYYLGDNRFGSNNIFFPYETRKVTSLNYFKIVASITSVDVSECKTVEEIEKKMFSVHPIQYYYNDRKKQNLTKFKKFTFMYSCEVVCYVNKKNKNKCIIV